MEDNDIPVVYDRGALFGEVEADSKKEVKGMYDLMGYLPEELEWLKVYVCELDKYMETKGVEEFLRRIGRESDTDIKDAFACGVLLGDKVQQLLGDREE